MNTNKEQLSGQLSKTLSGARPAQILVHDIPTSTWDGKRTEYTFNHKLNTTELIVVVQEYNDNKWTHIFTGYEIDSNNVYIGLTPPLPANSKIRLLIFF